MTARPSTSARPPADRDEPRIDGLVLDVHPDLVSRLSPESRAAIYLQLARSPLNPRYQNAVVFSAEDGSDYHAAVYLADGLIFGKNGHAPLAPWTILPLERIAGDCPQHAQGRVTYYRRKDL